MSVFVWLEKWFASQCNDDWEHERGVVIETIDNPGWQVKIDLTGTSLEAHAADAEIERAGDPPCALNGNIGGDLWMTCDIRSGQFVGAGDPTKLEQIVTVFQSWVAAQMPQ